jgi:hypothetical protein
VAAPTPLRLTLTVTVTAAQAEIGRHTLALTIFPRAPQVCRAAGPTGG